jgi:hypothetical protein
MSYLNSYKQDTLVSGTNIKTINGSSILGSGNLVVTGSGASWGSITGTLSSQTDLQTALNAKQDDITLTTTGSSGASTFIANTLNVPDYTLTGLGGVPTTRTLTINGSTQDLSANRTFTISDPSGWTTIVKSANQDVTNNATMQNDTDFQFSVVAGGHYMAEMNLCYSGNDLTGDYKFEFNVTSGGISSRGTCVGYNTGSATATQSIQGSGGTSTITISLGVVTADLNVLTNADIKFYFYCTANATMKFRFANNTAGAGRISRTWKGSILKYKRID